MRISVLTPTRNYALFLPDALRSVHSQEDRNVEHIIVDGASTDRTEQILQQWSGRVRWLSEPDHGQSDALNKAAAMARGEWLGWLNADEFYLPHVFEAIRAALHVSPNADVIYGDCCLVDVHGRLLRLLTQHAFHERMLRWYGPILSSCAAFIRASAIPGRGWDTRLRRTMDWDLYLELARQGAKFVHIGVPLAAFRLHNGQVTSVQIPNWSAEGIDIRSRHNLTVNPNVARLLRELSRSERGARKLFNGALRRQRRVRHRLRNADLRWFDSSAALRCTEQLIALSSENSRGTVGSGNGVPTPTR
jgi:glycosyltransferase involved in cell wall biosynthesis